MWVWQHCTQHVTTKHFQGAQQVLLSIVVYRSSWHGRLVSKKKQTTITFLYLLPPSTSLSSNKSPALFLCWLIFHSTFKIFLFFFFCWLTNVNNSTRHSCENDSFPPLSYFSYSFVLLISLISGIIFFRQKEKRGKTPLFPFFCPSASSSFLVFTEEEDRVGFLWRFIYRPGSII